MRYEVRMKPFMAIGLPELVPYADFHAMATREDEKDTIALLHAAAAALHRARKDLDALCKTDARSTRSTLCESEWRVAIKDALRACIAACITAAAVVKAAEGGDVLRLRLDVGLPSLEAESKLPSAGPRARYHPWWIVPTVTMVAQAE